MDAKPIRGFRVHGDENAIPTLPNPKTIHSRHKSSPALSTMAAAGAKPAIKRTAFGDVSNTFRANQATRDTSVPTSKQQPIQLQLEKKSVTTLQQPAQRPTSLATGLKELITHSVVSTKPTAEAFPKVPSTSAAHRALSRKNTTVFKDYTTSSKPADDQLNIRETTKADTALAPWSRNIVLNASNTSIAPKASEPERDLKTKSIPSVKAARVEPITQGPAATQNTGVRSSAGFVQSSVADIQAQLATGSDRALKQHVPSLRKTPLPTTLSVEQPGKASAKKTNGAVEIVAVKNVPLPVAEPEEHWDVDYEEEEDNYEDEAYVTARSFRSRGDNLTGNVTTTIVLKTNIKVRKELEAAAAVVQLSRPITELEDEAWDVTMVSEYKEEIFDYFKELEVKFAPKPHYMDFQTEIQWSMRAVLMDWVVQVHHRFQLLPETLFLCANLIDRFLSCKVVSLGKLQLVGATAIFIASKYEEINCPSVGEIVYMVDNGYSVEEVLKAERFMLTMLQFDLGWPGPMSFLRRISTADDYDLETRTLAKYFLEITIMDERFLGCPPSFTAAGAHCLARSMLKKGHWSTAHVYYSGYTYCQVLPILDLMLDCLADPMKHHGAVYEKYMDKRFKCASQFVKNEMHRGYYLPSVASNERQTYQTMCLDPSSLQQYTSRGLLEATYGGLVEQPCVGLPELW